MELDSVTVPVKPLVGATVMVDVPAVPAVVLTVVGLAETVKSAEGATTTAMFVEFVMSPFVPPIPLIVRV